MNSLIISTIIDIKCHASQNGNTIIRADKPMKMMVGWICTNTNDVWYLPALLLRTDSNLNKYIFNNESKIVFNMFLNNKIDLDLGVEINKLIKLKAFW
jgi:hypothetical protein